MIVTSFRIMRKKSSFILVVLFLLSFMLSSLAHAVPLKFSVMDPVGDNTGPIDVTKMDFTFDNSTGAYSINLTASSANPFSGNFRVNINLFNQGLGTTAQDPAFFQDVFNDFNLATSTTMLMLSGVNQRLLSWGDGDPVFTNSLGGTGNPDGSSLFRTAVGTFPLTFLTNEDYIAFADDGQPAIIGTPTDAPIPEPATLLLFGSGLVGLIGWRLAKSRKAQG